MKEKQNIQVIGSLRLLTRILKVSTWRAISLSRTMSWRAYMTFMKGLVVTSHTTLLNPTKNQLRKSRATNLNRNAKKTIKYASNNTRHRGKKTTGCMSRTGYHMRLPKSLKRSLRHGLAQNSTNGIKRLRLHQLHCLEKVGTIESSRTRGGLRNK